MLKIKATFPISDVNGCSQTAVNAVAAILHRDHAGGTAAGNDGNGLAGVAAQGKQKAVELLIIGIDTLDDVLPAQGRVI